MPPNAIRRVHGRALPALVLALAAAGICDPGRAQGPSSGPNEPGMPGKVIDSKGRSAANFLKVTQKTPQRSLSNDNFVYRADGKRLVDVLQDFAASQGVPAVTAEGLDGIVNANFNTKPELFLKSIAKAYNIIWYHDGTALYFYPGRAIESRIFRLKGFRRQELQSLLRSLDLDQERYPLRYDAAQNTLFVSGPPRLVDLVSYALEALEAGVTEGAGMTVRVFPLRFASASDRMMGETNIPGMVTTLRGLYASSGNNKSGPAGEPGLDAKQDADTNKKATAMMPQLRPGQYLSSANGRTDRSERPAPRPVAQAPDRDDVPPQFEADEGGNAVIVKGRADRMADYESLIKRLDQKPRLVELEATIIEVNSDSVDALGVNWSLRGARGSFSMGAPQTSSVLSEVNSFTLGTVISNAGRELLARVNALQGEGKARILSKPSVLGVANRTAVMREKRVASVRVAGNKEVSLFQVEAGTLLEMTPQVTYSDGANSIKLSLYIEDGSFETGSVDQIPIVKKTEIRTEAHVLEGESLLIGGITVESEQTHRSGVPGLSKLPVLGGLFRTRERQGQRTERLFLITPRLMDSGANARLRTLTAPEAPAVPAVPTPVRDVPAQSPAFAPN